MELFITITLLLLFCAAVFFGSLVIGIVLAPIAAVLSFLLIRDEKEE